MVLRETVTPAGDKDRPQSICQEEVGVDSKPLRFAESGPDHPGLSCFQLGDCAPLPVYGQGGVMIVLFSNM